MTALDAIIAKIGGMYSDPRCAQMQMLFITPRTVCLTSYFSATELQGKEFITGMLDFETPAASVNGPDGSLVPVEDAENHPTGRWVVLYSCRNPVNKGSFRIHGVGPIADSMDIGDWFQENVKGKASGK